jgi:hypothetical protein
LSVWIALDGWSLGHGIDASLGWSLLLLLLLVRGTAARKQSTWSILKSLTVTGTGNNPATNSRLPGAAANYYSGAGYLHHHSSVSSHGRVRDADYRFDIGCDPRTSSFEFEISINIPLVPKSLSNIGLRG